MVRPWKEPSAATRWVRPVRRVSLNAASLASVPELVKKTRPVGAPTSAEQPLGQLDLGLAGEEVGDVAEGAELVGDGRDQRRVGVAERVDGDAAEQVDVLLAVDVPDVGALTADEDELGRPEGVHQRAVVAVAATGRS